MKQLYEIHTTRPIRRPGYPYIGKPTRLYLDMDEVIEFMKFGAIFRIIENSTESPIRVTGENLPELHNRGISNMSTLERTDKEETKDQETKNLQEEECSTTNENTASSSTEKETVNNTVSNTPEKKFEMRAIQNNSFNKNYKNSKNNYKK